MYISSDIVMFMQLLQPSWPKHATERLIQICLFVFLLQKLLSPENMRNSFTIRIHNLEKLFEILEQPSILPKFYIIDI